MNSESGAETTTPAVSSVPVTLPLTPVDQKVGGQWTLTLHPAHLALADAPGAQPYVILRDQLMKSVTLMEGMRALGVERPSKLIFRLTPEGVKVLADWIGKPFLASFYLKRRYTWITFCAIIWLFGSLAPFLAPDPNSPARSIDVVGLIFGLSLLVASAFARWRPHPVLFLADAVWFACLAVNQTMNILSQGRSNFWFLLVALMIWVSSTGVRHFIRFRGTKIEPFRR